MKKIKVEQKFIDFVRLSSDFLTLDNLIVLNKTHRCFAKLTQSLRVLVDLCERDIRNLRLIDKHFPKLRYGIDSKQLDHFESLGHAVGKIVNLVVTSPRKYIKIVKYHYDEEEYERESTILDFPISRLTGVTDLDLSRDKIMTDDNVRKFPLRVLNLENNVNISPEILADFNLTKLNIVNYYNCNRDRASCERVGKALLECTTLQELTIGEMADKNFRSRIISQMTWLQKINIRD
ncbi:MAG: hypothetical protein Hyperionvirus3_139 [Hyperionvirus sp.]|uniref:Uncharacterized protein n=1 Tax=Hyperionvirus sp. TaxID=2487770 RepID=A0A3G5AAW9_9VIRU|nr:MAG: hypothetical protein Hyperionvirus3_139 [Hyperionvirus sp.]